MTNIIALLTLVSSLIMQVQADPTVSPETRAKIYEVATEVLERAQDELAESNNDESMSDNDNENDGSASAAPDEEEDEGSVEVSFDDTVESIFATGHSDQILGTIEVKNETHANFRLSGSASKIAEDLGIEVSGIDGVSEGDLVFLLRGDRNSQTDIGEKGMKLIEGASATIQVRLKSQPRDVGTLTLSIDGTEKQISVVAND